MIVISREEPPLNDFMVQLLLCFVTVVMVVGVERGGSSTHMLERLLKVTTQKNLCER